MRHFRGLWARLFLAQLTAIAMGAVTLPLVAFALAPSIIDSHLRVMRANQTLGPIAGETAAALHEAVWQSLLVGGAAALVVNLLASTLITRQVAGPVQRLAEAARRLASGHYAERAPASNTTELDVLTHAFNDMAEALEASEARRRQLIGDVAHELRTPISTLEGYLDGLGDGVVEPSEETWALLREEAGRVRRLVEDLHALWRTEASPPDLDVEIVPPAALIESTVARLGPDFIAKGLTLNVSLPADLPEVRADRDRALQVLTNLLGNALRYTPAPGDVEIVVARDGATVCFTVCDTGTGLASDDLPLVFERFYRVDKSRSRALGGSGVGLAIAKALVEAMGGRIWADSPGLGQGATFSFTLPVA